MRLMILLCCLLGFAPSGFADDGKAQVTSALTKVSERVYAVRIVSVDGRNLPEGGRQLLRLAPGTHRLGLVAIIERSNSMKIRDRRTPRPQTLEVTIEAGKHYEIGARVLDPAYGEWVAYVAER
jgi:hypothetical protein